MVQRDEDRLLHDCEHRRDEDEFAELLEWFVEFYPTTRPGFAVEEPDGSRRTITNEEMGRYVSAANIINYRARSAHNYVAWMRQQQQEASDAKSK
jgi:hypothetical protein